MSDVVCVTIVLQKTPIVKNRISSGFHEDLTFREYFDNIVKEWNIEVAPIKSITVEIEDERKRLFTVSENETLQRARFITKGIFIKYKVEKDEQIQEDIIVNTVPTNAFNVLMGTKLRELEPLVVKSKKCELHNDVLKDIQSYGKSVADSHQNTIFFNLSTKIEYFVISFSPPGFV